MAKGCEERESARVNKIKGKWPRGMGKGQEWRGGGQGAWGKGKARAREKRGWPMGMGKGQNKGKRGEDSGQDALRMDEGKG